MLSPLQHALSLNGRSLLSSLLDPVEKDFNRGGKKVQLSKGSKLPRPESQRVSFRPSPSAPFNDHSETQDEELLTNCHCRLSIFSRLPSTQISSERAPSS